MRRLAPLQKLKETRDHEQEELSIIPLTIVLLSGCASTNIDADNAGYISLFNGSDLDGWVIENNAAFSARDGLLVLNKGAGWLRSEEEFGDFVFELDVRFLEKEANSGIFIRTGPTSKNDTERLARQRLPGSMQGYDNRGQGSCDDDPLRRASVRT